MSNNNEIPRVDFTPIAVTRSEEEIKDEEWMQVGQQLMVAFTSVGFCYMEHHGISDRFTTECVEMGKRFFSLPIEVKKRVLRTDPEADYCGWLPPPQTEGFQFMAEHFDKTRPPDYKETYNLQIATRESLFPTDDEVPGFRDTTIRLIEYLDILLRRCLHALGHALGLDNPKAMMDMIKHLGTKENISTLRYAFYASVKPGVMMKDQMRCSEHTDFGFITFLFQNAVRGLQAYTRGGQFIDVVPIKGAMLLNVGDSLERLTGGILRSANHRVVLDEETAKSDRYSVIYFAIADNGAILEALCGDQERYGEKLTSGEFLRRRAVDIFSKGEGITTHTTS